MDGKKTQSDGCKVHYSFMKILTGSDLSRRRLPFMTMESGREGPVLWLTACGHGDEVGGIVVIQDIFKRLRRERLLRGRIYAFPLMNPIGFETASRMITLSGEDLNRSFPGRADGSPAERIADQIFRSICDTRPSLVLDLHNDWRRSIPYALLDSDPGKARRSAYRQAEDYCRRSGLLMVREAEPALKTLSYTLLQHDIPSLTLELGESYVVSEKNIAYGIQAVWNILAALEMVAPPNEPFQYGGAESCRGRLLTYSHRPLSSSSGIIRFLVRPGDTIRKGRSVAKIYNTFGKLLESITALQDGIVLGCTDSSVAFPGVPVAAFGVYPPDTRKEPAD